MYADSLLFRGTEGLCRYAMIDLALSNQHVGSYKH